MAQPPSPKPRLCTPPKSKPPTGTRHWTKGQSLAAAPGVLFIGSPSHDVPGLKPQTAGASVLAACLPCAVYTCFFLEDELPAFAAAPGLPPAVTFNLLYKFL